jgi:hypothetical protein
VCCGHSTRPQPGGHTSPRASCRPAACAPAARR